MIGQFAFSFDRETFRGIYPTRQAALDAALKHLRERSDMPEGIFIGQWVQPDPQSADHAEAVIEAMRDRWENTGAESKFLSQITDQQLADLDHEIDRAIRTWLTKHDLAPKPTKVRAVSEHPVPNVHHVATNPNEKETSLMGEA
jgi:hypothetical protein